MAGAPPNQGRFTCGALNHWSRECPQRSYGFRPPATGANAIPTAGPILALPASGGAPAAAATPANNMASTSGTTGNSSFGYQPRPRNNWWKDNQDRFDKVYNKYVQYEESERKRKDNEEKERIKKEEEEKRNEWKKKREQLEAEMAARLDKRFEELGLRKKDEQGGTGQLDEVTRLKKENGELLRRMNGAGNSYGSESEVARLKRENEELKRRTCQDGTNMRDVTRMARLKRENEELMRKLSGEGTSRREGDCVSKLQNEICEFRKMVSSKTVESDEIFVLKQELGELKQSAFMKTNFEQEIAGLRKEVDALRRQNEKVVEETKLWKDEAMRPGNKRGSVAMGTPGLPNRGSPKPQWTDCMRKDDKWKEEYKKLQSLHKLANVEAELLKEKRAAAEVKRMEAENQIRDLEDKMSRLNAAEVGKGTGSGGTNLKERLETVTLGSVQRGRKETPGRGSTDEGLDRLKDVNNRFQFIEDQKKQLCNLKKLGLEPMCKEAGIRVGKVEQMVCELAEYRVEQAFGTAREDAPGSKGKKQVVDVDDDSELKDSARSEEGDERFVEL
ncbi:hypothetical protein CBR_g50956 [Chara braunii]|uniref:CCHC-type domain-containing protein n=1 Tax=Chara braunii TaxID=69332 RepID=A0A388M823_CHABU|nr:hypothetical protein CBR_g50956 [Chara braunii]|eukprot:GBG90612.1 hypothetical protein CBR_g50956 [Chara braunii]